MIRFGVTRWGMVALALSSVACAEQQAPRVADSHPGYQVVVYTGDDSSQETDVVAVCDYAACNEIAARLNERDPGTYEVEGLVTP